MSRTELEKKYSVELTFWEGFDAARRGSNRKDNPYSDGKHKNRWNEGYDRGDTSQIER